jgi:hypothetical protein
LTWSTVRLGAVVREEEAALEAALPALLPSAVALGGEEVTAP